MASKIAWRSEIRVIPLLGSILVKSLCVRCWLIPCGPVCVYVCGTSIQSSIGTQSLPFAYTHNKWLVTVHSVYRQALVFFAGVRMAQFSIERVCAHAHTLWLRFRPPPLVPNTDECIVCTFVCVDASVFMIEMSVHSISAVYNCSTQCR